MKCGQATATHFLLLLLLLLGKGRSQGGISLEHTAGLLEEGAVVCQETDLLWLLLRLLLLLLVAVIGGGLFLLLCPIQRVGIRLQHSARLGVQVLHP